MDPFWKQTLREMLLFLAAWALIAVMVRFNVGESTQFWPALTVVAEWGLVAVPILLLVCYIQWRRDR